MAGEVYLSPCSRLRPCKDNEMQVTRASRAMCLRDRNLIGNHQTPGIVVDSRRQIGDRRGLYVEHNFGSAPGASTQAKLCFGPFELDVRTAELHKGGHKVRLQEQPFQILMELLQRPGEIVSREEIRRRLWPSDTVVEFDHSINAAIKRLRNSLCDSAENPRYIETLARRGYRFISPVVEQRTETQVPTVPDVAEPTAPAPPSAWSRTVIYGLMGAALVAVALWTLVAHRPGFAVQKATSNISLTRLTFDEGLTTDPTVSADGKLLSYASDRGSPGTLHIWLQQLVPNGQAVQLTRGEWEDHEPAFSPDGSTLAFRSERERGGIYLVPTVGGAARLLAKGGRDPRFSPDGRTIATWEPKFMWAPVFAIAGRTYLIDLETGTTQPLSGLVEAGMPEWSPDGKRLIVFGRSQAGLPWLADWDWWVLSPNGGKAVATGAFRVLKANGFEMMLKFPRVARWREGELWFSGLRGDSVNTWSIGFGRPGNESQVSGSPQRLTAGNGFDVFPSPAYGGRMVFAGLSVASDVWTIRLNANEATVLGSMRRETQTAGPHIFASLATDGTLLAFSSLRYGRQRAMLRHLATGLESTISNGASNEIVGTLSKDGSLVAFLNDKALFTGQGAGYVTPTKGGAAELFCQGCIIACDFSPDNSVVLYHQSSMARTYNRISHQDSLLTGIGSDTYQEHYSSDGKWIVFGKSVDSRSEVNVAPLRSFTEVAPRNEWIRISDGTSWTDKPRWSPNGRWIYYLQTAMAFSACGLSP